MNLHDHLPPQNLEAERSVLGGCMLDPIAVDLCAEILRPDDFYRDAHGLIFETILHLKDSARPVDAVELADELIRRGRYQDIGGNEGLAEIAGSVPHGANAHFHAQIVRQKAILRQVIQSATETIKDGYSNQFTAHEIVEKAEQRIFAIAERDTSSVTWGGEQLIAEAFEIMNSRKRGEKRGLMTGFDDLDCLLDGMRNQDLIIMAARPSQGKSAFATTIMANLASAGTTVLFISLEMPRADLTDRLWSSLSGVPTDRIRRPWLQSEDQQQRLGNAAYKVARPSFQINDSPRWTVTQIAACARRTKARHGLGLLIVDYMGLIDGLRQKGDSRQEEVAGISRRLKAMARDLNVPVLCLHQLNRQSEQREGHRPRLGDLRESGQIEQDADVVLLIHRPEYYDPNDQPGIAEIIVAKNRNGPTGAVRLAFVKHCTRFEAIPDAVPGAAY